MGYARTTIRKFTGRPIQKDIEQALRELVEEGLVTQVRLGKRTMYTLPALLDTLPYRIGKRQLWFLSPFDKLVINRARTRLLFDFDYQIECYVPEPKRQFGYYCLPILWGDKLIGRLDAKAERDKNRLQIHLLQIEPGTHLDETLVSALAEELLQLATANGGAAIRITRTEPGCLKSAITRRLA